MQGERRGLICNNGEELESNSTEQEDLALKNNKPLRSLSQNLEVDLGPRDLEKTGLINALPMELPGTSAQQSIQC